MQNLKESKPDQFRSHRSMQKTGTSWMKSSHILSKSPSFLSCERTNKVDKSIEKFREIQRKYLKQGKKSSVGMRTNAKNYLKNSRIFKKIVASKSQKKESKAMSQKFGKGI